MTTFNAKKIICSIFSFTHTDSATIYKSDIIFTGRVPQITLEKTIASSSGLFLISKFEGFGIPILESLFSKTPVITSKGGCFSEAGGKGSRYINPLSIDEMKKTILEIQNSTKLQNSMAEKGFEYAQNFTDDKISTNLMSVYNKL